MGFQDLKLNKPILKAISEKHYTEPTEVQQRSIPVILEGKDIMVTAQTGTGKTAAFVLPITQLLFDKQDASKKGKKIRALILSPTRELAIQIGNEIKDFTKHSRLKTATIYGGTSIEPQQKVLKAGVDILVATPGRLLDLNKQGYINLKSVEILVLDEADLMLDMGFADDVKKIVKLCPEDSQSLLFSATMPQTVTELGKAILTDPVEINISASQLAASTVEQKLFYVPISKKMQLCLHLLKNDLNGKMIIFRRTKYGVEKLEQFLNSHDFKAESIHGAKTQSLRQEALKTFKNNGAQILIATDVASRGIDINELDLVINFDLPLVPETYVHRIGRSGRAGKKGLAYSFCAAEEKTLVPDIQALIKQSIPVEENHPFVLDPDAKPAIHKRKGSKYKKGRKSAASKKKKKRWY